MKSKTIITTTTVTTTTTTTTTTAFEDTSGAINTTSHEDINGEICGCDVKIGIDAWTPNLQGHNWTMDGVLLWLREDMNITVNNGARPCQVEIISASHENNDTVAVAVAEKLVELGVLVIVGLEYSSTAIPVGEAANDERTPMIAFASNTNVTHNHPYVFRISIVDSIIGTVMAKLGKEEYNATNAAIVYQEDDPYSNGLARNLKASWEHLNGLVASFIPFTQSNVENSDFSMLLSEIISVKTTADVLFVPIVQNSVASVVTAIHKSGWRKPIIGADGWSDADELQSCGEACVGALFTANFIADGDIPQSAERTKFVDKFMKKYNYKPNPTAALAYDALNLIKTGLEKWNWSCNLIVNRNGLRDAMDSLTDFSGVSGFIPSFDENRNPTGKCVPIGKVDSNFQPILYDEYCV